MAIFRFIIVIFASCALGGNNIETHLFYKINKKKCKSKQVLYWI